MTRHTAWVVLPALLAGGSLRAQAQEADVATLDEVVVTAQKREETLRDVPLSVAAVSGAKLAEAGIVRMDDLKAYVPSLQVTETGIANNIYIRGIGSGLNQGFEQSVSTYADGVYRGRGHQSRMPFLDLARVEVLRGPQPILFGKNAVAGAVNLVSALPGSQFESALRGSYDFELDESVGEGMLSGPLSDTVGARLAVRGRNSQGYEHNLTTGQREPRRDETSGRLTLTWKPSEQLDGTLRYEAGSFHVRGRQVEIFGEAPSGNPAFGGLTYSQIISGGALPLVGLPGGLPQGTSASAANNVLDFQRSSQGDTSDFNTHEASLTFNYRFANSLTLTSVTGFSKYDLAELCDCDFVGATVFNASDGEKYNQLSQELRLTSAADQTVSWIGGIFFQRYDLQEHDYLYLPPTSLAIPVLSLNPALGATPAQRAANAAVFANAANPRTFTQDSKLYSAFAQATWHVTDRLRVSGGGRYSSEKKHGTRVTSLTAGLGGPLLPAATYPLFGAVLGIVPHNLAGERSESNFSPLVNVQFDFAKASMAYVSAARGYKAGGFDARSNKPPVAGGTPLNSGTFEFEDEQATTYEAGIKSRIGEVAEVNGDIFYTDYKDLQTSSFDGVIGFNVGNGSARVQGAELDARWQATRGLRLSGSVAYLDFRWTSYFGQCPFGRTPLATGPNAGNCDHSGESNQLAPKVSGVLSAEYAWALGGNMRLRTAVDATYSDSYLLSLNLDPNATQGSYTKLNARIAWTDSEQKRELALIGRNLTDKTVTSYAGDTPLASRLFTARSYYGFVDPPRSVALEFSLRF